MKLLDTIPLLSALLYAPLLYAIEIPKNLTSDDRTQVARILGTNTSTKTLSSPYPLGGHSGFEIGISLEVLPIKKLSQLGDTTEIQEYFKYPKISIGKGIYNDMDVFIHFAPFTTSETLEEYGFLFRYNFFQAKFIPLNVSLQLHSSSVNFMDRFSSTTTGIDLVSGMSMSTFAFYFGLGSTKSFSRFSGGTGPESITDTNNEERVTTNQFHTIAGLTFHREPYFISLQVDRYRDPVYNIMLGSRF